MFQQIRRQVASFVSRNAISRHVRSYVAGSDRPRVCVAISMNATRRFPSPGLSHPTSPDGQSRPIQKPQKLTRKPATHSDCDSWFR